MIITNFLNKRTKYKFIPEILSEGTTNLQNPSRGWYEIYSFDVEKKEDFEQLKWCLRENQTLALLRFNLKTVKKNKLSKEQLNNIENIIVFFIDAQKDVILRFAYDTEGFGLANEPSDIGLIQLHMGQLGDIIQKYKKNIYVIQGLFVGSWGEMHTSAYISQKDIKNLTSTMLEAVGNNVFLAVRKPVHLRYIYPQAEIEKLQKNELLKIGLYNDGIFGSDSHLGTFGENKASDSMWEEPWCTDDELEFENKLCKIVPQGGEVVCGQQAVSGREAFEVLKKMQISYLNCVHDIRLIDKWKNEVVCCDTVWNKKSYFDYIGAHLGYRIIVKDVNVSFNKKDITVSVKVENKGFATLYDAAVVLFTLKEFSDKDKIKLGNEDEITVCHDISNNLKPDTEYKFKVRLPLAGGKLYIRMERKKDGKSIRFANENYSEDSLCIGKVAVL